MFSIASVTRRVTCDYACLASCSHSRADYGMQIAPVADGHYRSFEPGESSLFPPAAGVISNNLHR